MTNPHQNRRSNYRIDMLVPVSWQVLEDEAVQLIKQGLGHTLFQRDDLSTPIDEYLDQAIPDSEEEQLYRALQYINNKLDYLIEQVLSKSIENRMVRDKIIELSASGIKFITQRPILTGTYLKMNMIMPGTFQYQIDFVTQIMRVEQRDKDRIIAANIVYIDKDARESMIKVIFQKQRKEIRKRKFDEEEMNVS